MGIKKEGREEEPNLMSPAATDAQGGWAPSLLSKEKSGWAQALPLHDIVSGQRPGLQAGCRLKAGLPARRSGAVTL